MPSFDAMMSQEGAAGRLGAALGSIREWIVVDRASHRWRLGLILMLLLAVAVGGTRVAAQGTPVAGSTGHLVVADIQVARIYLYDVGTRELTGQIDGATLNDHAGFLMLPDGRLLFADATTEELVAVQLDAPDGPAVVGRVPVPGLVSHFAVDPTASYAVVGSDAPSSALTLVDLSSYTSRPMAVEAGEAGVMIGGNPVTLYHRNDKLLQVEAYPVASVQRGSTTPTSVVATGAFGHGEAIDHRRGRLYLATDDGLDVVALGAEGELAFEATIPWDASGRTGGRGYFVRLSPDNRHLVSYMADRGTEETPWGEWRNDAYLVDLETDEATRVELGAGLVYRFALSDPYALFFSMHPDDDAAHLLDVDPASPTYGTVVAVIPLDPLANGPTADASPWESESRIAAITPDGATGFISRGGEGQITVIDTAERVVSGTIEVPSALSGGGYMTVVTPDMPFVDTVGR